MFSLNQDSSSTVMQHIEKVFTQEQAILANRVQEQMLSFQNDLKNAVCSARADFGGFLPQSVCVTLKTDSSWLS